MLGLNLIVQNVAGKNVLDLGCAEACIAARLVERGADRVDAVDANISLLATATEKYLRHISTGRLHLHFGTVEEIDRNDDLLDWYDMVLLLSIVHKLSEPIEFLEKAMRFSADWLAVRLPIRGVNYTKARKKPFDVLPVIQKDFDIVAEPMTCRGEWLGIFRRK
jgi:SAM-dependent methyltransferase